MKEGRKKEGSMKEENPERKEERLKAALRKIKRNKQRMKDGVKINLRSSRL